MNVQQPKTAYPRIAVIIPCYNEEIAIAGVVSDFQKHLPEAQLYVFDNGSTDHTVEEARRAGAVVLWEKRRGKGYVISAMFRRVEADVYVMVDGDGTYPADQAKALIAPIISGEADMVVGSRLHPDSRSAFKLPNLLGNWVFRSMLNSFFNVHVTDLLSGYRAMNRQLIKSLPFLSHGFESETELTIKCIERGYRIQEIPVNLMPRPAGSRSKIHPFLDTVLIVRTILGLVRDYKPLTAFGLMGLVSIVVGLIPGLSVIQEYVATGHILRIPSAILAAGAMIAGLLLVFVGLVLHSLARHFQEVDYQLRQLIERIEQP